MASAQQRIDEIEREIIGAANLKAELVRLAGECRTDFGRETIRLQIKIVESHVGHAQNPILAIEKSCFAELAMERRNRKYPAVAPVKKSTIQFADDEEQPRDSPKNFSVNLQPEVNSIFLEA